MIPGSAFSCRCSVRAHIRTSTYTPVCNACSLQVVSHAGVKPHIDDLFTPAKPYGEKKNGIAYVNSNCGALSGRTEIMRSIMNLNDSVVPVHSYGRCDRNMDVPGDFNKVELIHGYKFCVAMENSITKVSYGMRVPASKTECQACCCPEAAFLGALRIEDEANCPWHDARFKLQRRAQYVGIVG